MVRISKQAERRAKRPHRNRAPAPKSGPKKDQLPLGFKEHKNSVAGTDMRSSVFIAKIS